MPHRYLVSFARVMRQMIIKFLFINKAEVMSFFSLQNLMEERSFFRDDTSVWKTTYTAYRHVILQIFRIMGFGDVLIKGTL